jgi:hypothetical protein
VRCVTSLFDEVKALNLPRGDFAIFGSGPLIVRGIIPASNDLDIICRGEAWDEVQAMGIPTYLRASVTNGESVTSILTC